MPNQHTSPHPIAERLSRYIVTPSGCWEWQGGKDKNGYGRIAMGRVNGKPLARAAHVVSYEHYFGRVPAGRYICHHCDNPACIRPAHLYAGTPGQNSADMVQRGRNKPGPSALTPEQVEQVRASTATHKELAAQYSVAVITIRRAKRGRWRPCV